VRKGYYLFLECGSLSIKLTVACIFSFVISLLLFIITTGPNIYNWYNNGLLKNSYYFETGHAWTIFFFSMGLVLFITNKCIHAVCRDIATLLKDIEDKYSA
jgi:hypothetical protein